MGWLVMALGNGGLPSVLHPAFGPEIVSRVASVWSVNGSGSKLRQMRHLETLLEGVLDYAGLFPPARLELPDAIRNFETYRQGMERRLLGRFVIPASRLKELPSDAFSEETELGVIGHEGDWPEARAADAAAMNAFLEHADDSIRIAGYEVRLPEKVSVLDPGMVADLVRFGADETFLELPLEPHEVLAENLAILAESEALYAKARLSPAPSAAGLATFLQGCLQLDLPFKLTAGLHHPFAEPGSGEFGFLPILGACALALSEDLSRRELEEALSSGEGWSFASGVVWRDHVASSEAIEETRDLFLSFGSCSVQEPEAALRDLGLWPF